MKINCVCQDLAGWTSHIYYVSINWKSWYILARSSALGVSQAGNHSVGSRFLTRLTTSRWWQRSFLTWLPLVRGSTGKESANFIHMAAGKIQFLEGCWTEGLIPCWLLDGGYPQFSALRTSATWHLVSLTTTRENLLTRGRVPFL